MRAAIVVLSVALALAAQTAIAAENVDLELVLLADASRSIDDDEIVFQRRGFTKAITHPNIIGAIRQGRYRRIAVIYVEWGDENAQDVVVPWTIIEGKKSAGEFARKLMNMPRRARGMNATGPALHRPTRPRPTRPRRKDRPFRPSFVRHRTL